MQDCVFCKIVSGVIPAAKVTETEDILVFKDNEPSAPTHFLIIPKKHFESFSDVSNDIWIKIKEMMLQLAKAHNLKAFRIVSNWGDYQSVKHLHIHFTAGFTKKDY